MAKDSESERYDDAGLRINDVEVEFATREIDRHLEEWRHTNDRLLGPLTPILGLSAAFVPSVAVLLANTVDNQRRFYLAITPLLLFMSLLTVLVASRFSRSTIYGALALRRADMLRTYFLDQHPCLSAYFPPRRTRIGDLEETLSHYKHHLVAWPAVISTLAVGAGLNGFAVGVLTWWMFEGAPSWTLAMAGTFGAVASLCGGLTYVSWRRRSAASSFAQELGLSLPETLNPPLSQRLRLMRATTPTPQPGSGELHQGISGDASLQWPSPDEPLFENTEGLTFVGYRGSPGWFEFVECYREGARALANTAEEGTTHLAFPQLVGIPIMHLYRQYLELEMKRLILTANPLLNEPITISQLASRLYGHDLTKLWKKCREVADIAWPGTDAGHATELDAVSHQLQQFMEMDPSSDAARYPVRPDGTATFPPEFRNYDISRFADRIERIGSALAGVTTGLAEELDHRNRGA